MPNTRIDKNSNYAINPHNSFPSRHKVQQQVKVQLKAQPRASRLPIFLVTIFLWVTTPSVAVGAVGDSNRISSSDRSALKSIRSQSESSFSGNMQISASTLPVRSVVVVGGTHGNEYTGVWVVKALERKLQKLTQQEKLFESFQLSTIMGNPQAHMENKRFVDQDLNRQFAAKTLKKYYEVQKENPQSLHVEARRALELDQLLGPKFHFASSSVENGSNLTPHKPKTDMIIDLHTTTTNMGTTLIVAAGDPLTTKAAAYVMMKCQDDDRIAVLMHTHKDQQVRPHLSSIATHCFSIEVGAVPQGVLRHDKVENTQAALDATLEFVHRYNTQPEKVNEELRQAFPTGNIPCYVSAPALQPGEMSGKISWPCDPANPNFPHYLVHKSLQDNDFAEIRTGDPLFVDLDGQTIAYNGSHGSPIRVLFVNEGGYYYASSGTGISVANLRHYLLETGELLPAFEHQ